MPSTALDFGSRCLPTIIAGDSCSRTKYSGRRLRGAILGGLVDMLHSSKKSLPIPPRPKPVHNVREFLLIPNFTLTQSSLFLIAGKKFDSRHCITIPKIPRLKSRFLANFRDFVSIRECLVGHWNGVWRRTELLACTTDPITGACAFFDSSPITTDIALHSEVIKSNDCK